MKRKCSILFIFFLILLWSCKKEYSCESCQQGGALSPGDTLIYYQLTIDNKDYVAIAFQDNTFLLSFVYEILGRSVSRDSGIVVGASLHPNGGITGGPEPGLALHVERGIIKNYSILSQTDFQNYFNPGNYSYTDLKARVSPFTPVFENGIAIRWDDENGSIWRTDYGTGNQNGSKFTITKRQAISNSWAWGLFPMRVTAEFNCILYDTSGRSKVITKGKISYYFAKH